MQSHFNAVTLQCLWAGLLTADQCVRLTSLRSMLSGGLEMSLAI